MELTVQKSEVILRVLAMILAVLAVCLVGFDEEVKVVLYKEKKATEKDMDALFVLVVTQSVAAGYQLVRLCKCFILSRSKEGSRCYSKSALWIFFLSDQMVAYITFSVTMAATQGSSLAVTGANQFQWIKICNIYTKFCRQIGAGLFSSISASMMMAALACISAFDLFRLYSVGSKEMQ